MTSLASAFVTIRPDTTGFGARLSTSVSADASKAGAKAGGQFTEKFKGALKVGAALAGAFAVTKGISLFGDALDASAGISKLKAQLGTTKAESARIGKAAGNLFGQGYGTGMEQVQEAVGAVVRDIDGMRGASENTLERISGKVANTANIFDQDLGGVTRAVSQLMRTGLAKNADQALDIVTKGFQNGADKSGDFLDTLNEYGTQFRKLGLSGKDATGIISQGLKAGARDGDLVADSIKEFSIRAVDGSDATQTAFHGIGLSAEKMESAIAKGGPSARKALGQTLDALRAVKDPAERSRQAVALFGTQAEDMGKALFAIDPSNAVDGLGKVKGAADRAGDAFNDNAKARISTFFRGLQAGAIDVIGNQVIPAFEGLMPMVEGFAGVLVGDVIPAVSRVVHWFTEHETATKSLAVVIGALVAVTQAHAAVMAVQAAGGLMAMVKGTRLVTAVSKTWTAVQWLLNAALSANPIGLVIAAIAGLVVGLVVAYKKSETFRNIVNGAFNAVKDASQALWDRIKSFFGWLGEGFRKMGQLAGDFRQAIGNAWDAVKRGTQTAVLFVVDKVLWLADKMLGAMAKAFSWVPGLGPKLKKASDAVGAFRAAVNAEMDKINDEEVKVTVRGITETIKGASRSTGEFASIGKARGGPIPMLPGAVPGKDSVHVLAMPGEHYLTADEVKKAGGHHGVEAIRAGIRAGIFRKSGDIGWDPGRRSREGVQALANGGPVFDVNTHLPPTGAIVAAREHMTDQLAAEMTKRLKAAAAAALRKAAMGGSPLPGGGKLTPAQIARGQAFARREAGKPYIWGGVGPTGYDCSGFVSAVLNAALGVGPYFRRGSTGTMPWPGSSPGTGSFTYGFFKGSPGHTAGNIGGLAFESTNGSTRVGGAARSATSFPSVYHYDRGGMARGAGFLPKGTTRPERVLSPRQTEAFERLVDKLERGGTDRALVHIENQYTHDPHEAARATRREQEKALALAVMP